MEDNVCRILSKSGKHQTNEDINFRFIPGFSVSGKVVGEGCSRNGTTVTGTHQEHASQGPKGVSVALSSLDNNNISRQNVISDSTGAYSFYKVFPGKYNIMASHPNWTLSGIPIEINLEWDNITVKTPIVVSGYDVTGSVFSGDVQEPVEGVHFLLYSSTIKNLSNCNVSKDLQFEGIFFSTNY